jgi:hypothetical protein
LIPLPLSKWDREARPFRCLRPVERSSISIPRHPASPRLARPAAPVSQRSPSLPQCMCVCEREGWPGGKGVSGGDWAGWGSGGGGRGGMGPGAGVYQDSREGGAIQGRVGNGAELRRRGGDCQIALLDQLRKTRPRLRRKARAVCARRGEPADRGARQDQYLYVQALRRPSRREKGRRSRPGQALSASTDPCGSQSETEGRISLDKLIARSLIIRLDENTSASVSASHYVPLWLTPVPIFLSPPLLFSACLPSFKLPLLCASRPFCPVPLVLEPMRQQRRRVPEGTTATVP